MHAEHCSYCGEKALPALYKDGPVCEGCALILYPDLLDEVREVVEVTDDDIERLVATMWEVDLEQDSESAAHYPYL